MSQIMEAYPAHSVSLEKSGKLLSKITGLDKVSYLIDIDIFLIFLNITVAAQFFIEIKSIFLSFFLS